MEMVTKEIDLIRTMFQSQTHGLVSVGWVGFHLKLLSHSLQKFLSTQKLLNHYPQQLRKLLRRKLRHQKVHQRAADQSQAQILDNGDSLKQIGLLPSRQQPQAWRREKSLGTPSGNHK